MEQLEPEMTRRRTITPVGAVLLIIATAAVSCVPFLTVGVPTNGDARDHVTYEYLLNRQISHGDLYPRWLENANKGYGSPIFLIQYPFPYFVAASLRPIFSFTPPETRETRELGLYCFLMLVGAGLAAYYWFCLHCGPTASTLSAIAYMLLPYLWGVVLYNRVAVGELATFVWMPLLFALCDRATTTKLGTMSAIAVAFALLLLSNILTAGLFVPVLILYAFPLGRRTMLSVLFALMFGICLAAVYIVPALAYQGLFTPGAVVSHRYFGELGRNLLYVTSSERHSRRLALPVIVTIICLSSLTAYQIVRGRVGFTARMGMLLTLGLGLMLLIPSIGPKLVASSGLKVSGYDSFEGYSMDILFSELLTVGLGCLAYCRISRRRTRPQERVLLVVCCCAFVLMLPWAAIIWKVIPGTDILQFPWRLSSIVTVAVAGLFSTGIDDCLRQERRSEKQPSLRVMAVFAIITIGVGGIIWRIDDYTRHPSTPRVDLSRWMDPMYLAYIPPSKLDAFARSVGFPRGDYYDVGSTPIQSVVTAEYTAGSGSISISHITPGKLLVTAESQRDSRVQIGQLYFPLWKIVPVTGFAGGETLGSSAENLMEVSLTPGQHEFWLMFDTGLPERLGAFLSLTSVLVMVAGLAFVALHRRKPGIRAEGLAAVHEL